MALTAAFATVARNGRPTVTDRRGAGPMSSPPQHIPARAARLDRHGARDALALTPAIAPMGLALGVALGELAAPPLLSWLSAPLLVAGSSQLVLLSQLDGGAGVLAATGAALLVNSRFVVYGAALAPRFSGQPRWFRRLGPHFIVDQTYGLVTARDTTDTSVHGFRRYFTTASVLLWLVWTVTVGAGLLLGTTLPESLPLEFVLPAMFVALVVPGLRSLPEALAAVAGAVLAIGGGGPTATLFTAVVAGAAIGARAGRER
jgi:predicted branched-subunit amino acid permease